MVGGAVMLAVAGVLAGLVVALGSDDGTDAASVAVAPDVGRVSAAATTTPPAATSSPPPKRTPSPTASATTAAPRPSATKAPPTTPTAAASAASVGRIRPGTDYQGVATHYDAGNGDGACLFGPSDDLMIAAMNTTDYETSKACGAHVLVRAANGKSITVRITNECPLPCAPGQLDLSRQAFAKLADPVQGRIPITWSLLSPGTAETISLRYKTGSSRHWCGIQAIGHRNPVARLEVNTSGGWRQLTRTEYNYFLSADGAGCGGSIRVTDIYGERLTFDGIAIRPDAAQPTGRQFARH